MTMSPGVRKFALTGHVVLSVGWLGSVVCFLVLAIVGLTNEDTLTVRAAYLSMELITRFVIVPLCLVSLFTGLVQSLGTPWGLFRHYWVIAKLLLTLFATLLLLLHTRPISYMADVARETVLSRSDLRPLRIQLVADAGAALAVLLVTTLLSVYKPQGRTRFGRRTQHRTQTGAVDGEKLPPFKSA